MNDNLPLPFPSLDLSLFNYIPSQTTPNDKRALLALHEAVRCQTKGNFVYLEIGSHLGGSLQALVADPACSRIISIDPRPDKFRDQRGLDLNYPENSTAKMLQLLSRVPHASIAKIETFEANTAELQSEHVRVRPDYCFIDGEHTDAAALRDARFCLKVVKPDGCIAFHDANIVFHAIDTFLTELHAERHDVRCYVLPDTVFVVELGRFGISEQQPIKSLLADNYQAYLFGLKSNDWYRAVLNKPLFRKLRATRFVRRLFIVPGAESQGV
jgi:hypothetical protein